MRVVSRGRQAAGHLASWVRAHWRMLVPIVSIGLLIIAVPIVFRSLTDKAWRDSSLYLVQVFGLFVLVAYVTATFGIARYNRGATEAAEVSARAASGAAEAAKRSSQVSEKMLAETRAAREAQELQAAPRVVVYPEIKDIVIVDLVIENVGQSWAQNVTVVFDPPLRPSNLLQHAGLVEVAPFFRGVPFNLGPGKRFTYLLDESYKRPINLSTPIEQKAIVQYGGAPPDETITLDFVSYFNQMETTLKPPDHFNDALTQLSTLIHSVESINGAMSQIASRLDAGLVVTAGLVNPLGRAGDEEHEDRFVRLVRSLTAEWRLWQGIAASRPASALLSKQRLRLLIQAALLELPYWEAGEDVRSLARAHIFEIESLLVYPAEPRQADDGREDAGGPIAQHIADLEKLINDGSQEAPPSG